MTHKGILATEIKATLERVAHRVTQGERVLLVQDTTSVDFSHHPATQGMGALENRHCRGFLAHTTLAVSTTGLPLGLINQQVWVRKEEETGKRHQRHKTAFAAKESYKWVKGLAQGVEPQGERTLPVGWQGITVCDREAHILEFFAEVLQQGLGFIVRAAQGRSTTIEGETLFAAVAQQRVQATQTLALKRRPQRKPRQATLAVRYGSVTLRPPRRGLAAQKPITIQVVDVTEPAPPPGEEGVHWLLLTSLPVGTPEQANEVVRFYTYRWLIERFHYILKSGCKLEESQLREEQRIERLLALYTRVAWRLLWMTYLVRQTPDASCTILLDTDEWQALYVRHQRTNQLPHAPPTLHEAVRWIAQLGGFPGRKGDGEPGVKVLWLGWVRLQDIVELWRLLKPTPPPL